MAMANVQLLGGLMDGMVVETLTDFPLDYIEFYHYGSDTFRMTANINRKCMLTPIVQRPYLRKTTYVLDRLSGNYVFDSVRRYEK